MISLLSYLRKDLIRLDLEPAGKDDLFRTLTETMAGSLGLAGHDSLLSAIRERESAMSTGIGEGIAIPHAKSALLSEVVIAFARLKKPLDYDALDGKPVRLVFMLMGPAENATLHVKVLAKLARMLKNPQLVQQLNEAATPDAVLGVLQGQEAPGA